MAKTKKRSRTPWRVLAGRIVINGLAAALVVLLLPGIHVSTGYPVLGYLAIGAVLGVVNAFVKPVFQFVALPLLLGSLGLAVILVDALIFWLLDLLIPFLHTDSWLWLILAGVLLALFSYILDNLAGLSPPILSDRSAQEQSS
jgi:putative membrane protein